MTGPSRWVALLAAMISLAGAPCALADLPPLIPRALLFGNPERGQPRLSPDGTRLAYLARSPGGKTIVWVRSVDGRDSMAVTREDQPEVRGVFWAPDGQRLLTLRDRDGDENWHLYAIDPGTGAATDLTPFEGVRAEIVAVDPRHPREVLVGLNQRDRRIMDVHRIDLATGAIRLDTENPGDVVSWTTDETLTIRAATALDPSDGSTILRVRERADAPWRDLVRWPFEQAGNDRYQRIIAFLPQGRELLVQSPIGANTTRIVAVDVASGREREVVPADPRADVWNVLDRAGPEAHAAVMRDVHTGAIQAVTIHHQMPEWKALDPAVAADFEVLGRLHPGVFVVTSRDTADRRWIVRYHVDAGPEAYFLYDRGRKEGRFLFTHRPRLSGLGLAKVQPVTVPARDGERVPCYLTLPAGVPTRGLPLVMLIHGGPWWRDEWGFNPVAQWLANRGYAVLQVNYRGSTGFGQRWLNAGDREFGRGAAQHDITDAARWAIAQGIADPRRVGIMGGSYGGYATLCGLAFTPDLYACGIDIVGPANLRTLIESFPPYWAARRKRWINRIGDVVGNDSLNRALSPLFHAQAIRAPLLIGHGANDPRARLAESEAIVKAMREHGRAVTFVVYPDEGHGFVRPANAIDFWARAEEFLARHLGGRAEPRAEVDGTSAEVR